MAEDVSLEPQAAADAAPHAPLPWRLWAWFALMIAGVAVVAPMAWFAWQRIDAWALANAAPAQQRAALTRDWSGSRSPDYLEVIAEISLNQAIPDEGAAYVAMTRVTELDPSRGFAWATLAYLETRNAGGKVNRVALENLTKSMDVCPLCDQALIRWRLNFVLANWAEMPEALRRRAFEQADLLRWIGDHAEFLAEMRFKAQLKGIPFDAYRAVVDTPARSWDIAPAARPLSTSLPPA